MDNQTKHEVSEDFIKKAHDAACSEWKERIEKEFPEIFKERSGWYKNIIHPAYLMYFDFKTNKLYGFNTCGIWYTQDHIENNRNMSEYRKATEEEVGMALIKEAKNRGFKAGVRIRSKWINNRVSKCVINAVFQYRYAELLTGSSGFTYTIFEGGEWAEVVEEGKTFSIGDRIKIDDDDTYIISRVKGNKISIVNLKSGNCWWDTIKVKDCHRITKKELNSHIGASWRLAYKK